MNVRTELCRFKCGRVDHLRSATFKTLIRFLLSSFFIKTFSSKLGNPILRAFAVYFENSDRSFSRDVRC